MKKVSRKDWLTFQDFDTRGGKTDRLYSLLATPFTRWHYVLCIA